MKPEETENRAIGLEEMKQALTKQRAENQRAGWDEINKVLETRKLRLVPRVMLIPGQAPSGDIVLVDAPEER